MEKSLALGMIETIGLPGLLAAADAAAKAADVKIVTYEGVDAGIVTLYVVGDVSSVQAAISVGEAEARRVGQLRHSHVIPRPDESVNRLIQKLLN
ncbi:BMC domain-containing protein, partial [Frankia sp. Mgl5]